jgi:hypothetical protein
MGEPSLADALSFCLLLATMTRVAIRPGDRALDGSFHSRVARDHRDEGIFRPDCSERVGRRQTWRRRSRTLQQLAERNLSGIVD